ncbi:MAG: TonB-dependent receptor [Deltaproteobacteria bacterium]
MRRFLMFVFVFYVSLQMAHLAWAENIFTLGEIEVTAPKEETKNITIDNVYDDEMREFNRDTVSEAVNLLPGVSLSRVGARNESTVYARGFDIKHVPLFLDGIPIYVPYDGYPDLGRFYTFDLSEIVVSKGFTSVLYGPNTMGGAINIVTKKPEKQFEGSAGIGYASGNTYRSYLNMGTNQKKWYLQASGSYVDSDYFRLSSDFKPVTAEDGGKRNNSYHKDEKLNFRFGYTPNKDDEYSITYINQHGKKGTPPYAGSDPTWTVRYWRWPYWDKESYYFTSRTSLGSKSYFKTRLYYDEFKNSLYSYDDATYSTMTKKSSFKSYYDDYTIGGSTEIGTSILPKNTLKLALHFKRDIHREHNEGNPIQHFEDEIFSAGLEDTIDITKDLYAILGISYDRLSTQRAEDYNSKTKQLSDFPKDDSSAFNPQIGLFYSLSDTGKLHASVSKKTRFASIKDKYSYRLGWVIPNPELNPEESINYEIGYQDLFFKKMWLKTAVFYSDISDFIMFVTVPDPNNPGKTVNQNQNIGKVRHYGLETDVSAEVMKGLESGLNYTYIYRDNRTNEDKLINVPKHKFFAYLKYKPLKKLTLHGNLEYNSKRYSSSAGNRVAGAFTLVNTKIAYEIIKELNIEMGVNNVFDKNYALDEGYPEPGRNYFANLTYRW